MLKAGAPPLKNVHFNSANRKDNPEQQQEAKTYVGLDICRRQPPVFWWRPKDRSCDMSLMLDPRFPLNGKITEHAQMTVALLTFP